MSMPLSCTNAPRKVRSSLMMVMLMASMAWSGAVPSAAQGLELTPSPVQHFPMTGAEGVNMTGQTAFSVPYNHTLTGGAIEYEPAWTSAGPITTRYGMDEAAGWAGQHTNTSGMGQGGQLSLLPANSLTSLTDFEDLIHVPTGWLGVGEDHEDWAVVTGVAPSLANRSPTGAPDGVHMLSTLGRGGLGAHQSGCLQSSTYDVPGYIANFTLTFSHFLAFEDTDAAWLEARVDGGTWNNLEPAGGYPNTTSLDMAPNASWSGQAAAWSNVTVDLEQSSLVTGQAFELRFCFQTGSSPGLRPGWFVDDVTVHNNGDLPGAWFHGNMSGTYADNALGHLYLTADLSGMNGSLDLEFWSDWDIQGGYADNLLTSVSTDNGSSWQLVSGIPGVPGNGYTWQGQFYGDESYDWVAVTYSLPSGIGSHPNASSVLIRFTVQTNHNTGYGGAGVSTWEGVVLDDVTLIHTQGTSSPVRVPLANFSSTPSGTADDPSGWKAAPTSRPNQWMWTTAFGRHPASTVTDSFEDPTTAPAGWTVEGNGAQGWEMGATNNTSGYGPGRFHGGTQGAAVDLDTQYTNNLLTHLITPETHIPDGATARVSFRSWMCSESNWDGGSVSVSTDGGDSWWWLPTQVPDFHDQISTANSQSPFFQAGIIDGSNVAGGCNSNKQRPFDLKSYDLSNLSGMDVRARFTFFSDTYVEADGWYIDDAGIEIDVFKPVGQWLSDAIVPHDVHGYGWVDAWYDVPNVTGMVVDVLDANMNPIPGHVGLTFPFPIAVHPLEHTSLHLRVRMNTSDALFTPRIHSLGVGSTAYASPASLMSTAVVAANAYIDLEGDLRTVNSLTVPVFTGPVCPTSEVRIQSFGDNITWAVNQAVVPLTGWTSGASPLAEHNHTLTGRPGLNTTAQLTFAGGERFERARIDVHCLTPPSGVELALGWNNATLLDQTEQHFGFTTHEVGFTTGPAPSNGASMLEPVTLNNASANLTWYTHETVGSLANDAGETHARLLLSDLNGTVVVTVGGQPARSFDSAGQMPVSPSASCPNHVRVTVLDDHVGDLYRCRLRIEVQGSATVSPVTFQHLPSLAVRTLLLNATVLNDAKNASNTGNTRAVLDVPLHVTTGRGGLTTQLNVSAQPVMVESVGELTHERWLPETTVTFVSEHRRVNPLAVQTDAPDLERITLWLSPTPNRDDAFLAVEVDRLNGDARFRQTLGSGLAFPTAASSVMCTLNGCTVTWSLTSTWLLDDVDDVHVLVEAVDVNGLTTGPAYGVEKTAFNEIENDLEVVDMRVTDDNGRRLDDWTHPLWPYHLPAEENMTASGRVRLQGIPGAWVEANEAEVTVTMVAVPPRNISGGADEWLGPPVEWSRSRAVQVDGEGRFTVALATPGLNEGLPSNTWLQIVPSITRRGPVDINASSSMDETVSINPVRVLHDTQAPSASTLMVLDAGRLLPAEDHVWMMGQDIPLRLSINDTEGLASPLTLWTWLEDRDDTNQNGLMEADEYQQALLSVNTGVRTMDVDLPLLAWSEVLPSSATSGRASVVVEGYDLAGNRMQGGGAFGEATDLATFTVQRRMDTTVAIESVSMDSDEGRLFPGQTHRFQLTLADGNGLSSLDAIQFNPVGEDSTDPCFVHYDPRFMTVTHDEACYLETPVVAATALNDGGLYAVTIDFKLRWEATFDGTAVQGTPSLRVVDEGQPLGLGLFRLNQWSWSAANQLDLRWVNITDTTAPTGLNSNGTHWFHRNDVIHHTLGLYHRNSSRPAENLPHPGTLDWELSDGARSIEGTVNITDRSTAFVALNVDADVMHRDAGFVNMTVNGMEGYGINDLHYNVVIDETSPTLLLTSSTLNRLPSDGFASVPVDITILDDTALDTDLLTVHVSIQRLGAEVPGSAFTVTVPLVEVNGTAHRFNGTVNMETHLGGLARSDTLRVWFEVADRSGRPLVGLGGETGPLVVGIDWVAFEPSITDLSATPYRPVVGDAVSVYLQIDNLGVEPGTTRVVLRDGEGTTLQSTELELNASESAKLVWTVEAWAEGRLGLTVELENRTPRIPVPLADVSPGIEDETTGQMAALSLSLLAVLVAFSVLLVVRHHRSERREAYEIERIRRIVEVPSPHAMRKRLVQLREEQ